jgi:hypothetical protein
MQRFYVAGESRNLHAPIPSLQTVMAVWARDVLSKQIN